MFGHHRIVSELGRVMANIGKLGRPGFRFQIYISIAVMKSMFAGSRWPTFGHSNTPFGYVVIVGRRSGTESRLHRPNRHLDGRLPRGRRCVLRRPHQG
jgi:hypothetical protein